MKIAVISRSEEIESTRRLVAAGHAVGHEMAVLPVLETSVRVDSTGIDVRLRGESIPRPDVVIPRIGTFMPELGLEIAGALEDLGVPLLNSTAAIRLARNKARSLRRLSSEGFRVPATVVVKDLDQVEASFQELGDGPWIIKPVRGSQGRGVIRCDSLGSAVSTLEAFLQLNRDLLIQEYIEAAAREDCRILVAGGEVITAVRRMAPEGAFRTNWSAGGHMERWSPGVDEVRAALRAAEVLGLQVAGVDLVPEANLPGARSGTAGGPLIIEVNSSPGFVGVEAVESPGFVSSRIIQQAEALTSTIGP